MLGVNARDLSRSASTAPRSSSSSRAVPADRIVIAESGIQTRAQGAAAELAGADAILVGSTLMRAPDPAAKLAELLSRPLVKVCGLTREEDVAGAAEAGADLAGLRARAGEPACRDTRAAGAGRDALGRRLGRRGRRRAMPTSIRCTRVEEGKVRGREAALLREGAPVARVLDLPWERTDPGHWERAAAAEGRVVLAGGLGPDNVREAIAAVRPWAVDAASSLEIGPRNQGSRQGAAYVEAARG